MKRSLLILLAFSQVASGGYSWSDPKELELLNKELRDCRRNRVEYAAKERELQSRLQSLPDDAPETERIKVELGETRQVLAVLAEREEQIQSLSKEKGKTLTAELDAIKEIGSTKRHPTKSDVSGAWTSEPNLTGYTLKLEQHGNTIRGRGYRWGCTGIGDIFTISGSYRNGVLSLTFDDSPGQKTTYVFHYLEERGRPRFKLAEGEYKWRILPKHELH